MVEGKDIVKFELLADSIKKINNKAGNAAKSAVNQLLTLRNWAIGYYIVEYEQDGSDRAEYGTRLLRNLENEISERGMNVTLFKACRQFYLQYPQIGSTVSNQFNLPNFEKSSTASNLFVTDPEQLINNLSFSHIREIMVLEDSFERFFYETECIKCNWSVRELRRQIKTNLYVRAGISRNPEALLKQTAINSKESNTLNDTIDYTSFKRGGLYKITDFQNLEQAMKYWFSNYKKIYNAQQAYGRILLDEDVKIVTINKFLAAMQLIEGYTQAYTDEEKEIKKFEEKKNEIISKLESEEEKELVGKGLGYSGISFRKAVKAYLYKGCNCFTDLSRTKFMKEKEKLINDIVNDRNFYTHSSNRVSATMEFDDLLNVASLCKELYRIISLKDMGLDTEIIKQRSQTNRMCYWLMKSIMKIEIENDTLQLGEFDSAMRYFSDSK